MFKNQHTTLKRRNTRTHAHPFNGPFTGTTRVSRYQKGKPNLDFTEARVCISLQADNHASTPPLSFLKAGCPSCRLNNSVKALKAVALKEEKKQPNENIESQTGIKYQIRH